MSRWLAWTLGALFVLALCMHAHEPLWERSAPGAGYSEGDLRALIGAAPCLDEGSLRTAPRPYFAAREVGLEPLGAASLALSLVLWSDGGALGNASPTPMRIENLFLFVIAAAGAGLFLRRLAAPWLGDDHARAAAWVTAVLCCVHPLAFAAPASLAARGDLLALAFGTWAAALFLRGRQRRETRPGIHAGLLAVLAGLSSSLALALPLVMAAAELVAGRRYRTWPARARTTLATLVGYGACVAVAPALRALLGVGVDGLPADRPAVETFAMALEKLGVLALPVNSAASGFAGYLLAAGIVAVALEPAFSAARSAPRLWSLILAGGAALVLAASFCGRGVRVHPGSFTAADALLAGLIVVSAALALASTALSGLRRALFPAILATGWAALAHAHASAWRDSIESYDRARADVARALSEAPLPAALCVLDVDESVQGFALVDRSRSHAFLGAPELVAKDAAGLQRAREAGAGSTWIAFPTRRAWTQFSRTARFEALRARGFALALEESPGEARAVLRLPPPAPSTGTRRWFREGSSVELDWEALTTRRVSALGPRDTDLVRAPILGWDGSGIDGRFSAGEVQGVWVDSGGEPRAHFDVGASVAWLCSGRVRKVWPVEGWSQLTEADAQDELLAFDPAPVPARDGDDWRIGPLRSAAVDAAETTLGRRGSSGAWSLYLCDLETLEQAVFDLVAESASPDTERVAHGAGRVARLGSARGRALAWCIEYSAAGVALLRAEGLVLPDREVGGTRDR